MPESMQEFKAELFRVLAHPTRIRILETLRVAGTLNVTELHQRLAIEPSNVSQHLAALRGQGLVSARREGTTAWYAISEPRLAELLDVARRIFERQLEAQTAMLAEEPPVPRNHRRN